MIQKPLNLDIIERESLAERVASFIRKAVIQGSFRSGDRLPEVWLSKRLGVSRAPIREAFRILEIEGFVEINLQKGARVRELTEKDIKNIYELRSTLDSLAVRLAMANLQEDHVCQLEYILRQMKSILKQGDINSYGELNSEFHNSFYQRSSNDWLCNVNNGLMNHIMRLRSLSLSLSARLHQSFREHVQIVKAVKNKDVERAEEMARQHTKEAGRYVLQHLETKGMSNIGYKSSTRDEP